MAEPPRRERAYALWVFLVLLVYWVSSVGAASPTYEKVAAQIPGMNALHAALWGLFYRPTVY